MKIGLGIASLGEEVARRDQIDPHKDQEHAASMKIGLGITSLDEGVTRRGGAISERKQQARSFDLECKRRYGWVREWSAAPRGQRRGCNDTHDSLTDTCAAAGFRATKDW